ncbi:MULTISPECIES: hypothetical protein [Actinoplanes]|uniref:hypothetical protein n=1 Tax=Actinoplanes TaxID=1865 RepID=UPI000696A128|nr:MULTISPECIES: hypothetical protein [Actinoplanes]GLY01539.1 hypothetical protein Acsp01_19180 [Actinoplanes sp. NBRC 101535]
MNPAPPTAYFPPPEPGSTVPPPPQGPGVHPPFPAPPVEGRGKRIGLGLGIGAGVLLLVCGGGTGALIGLGAAMESSFDEQAGVVVSRYLDAVQDRSFSEAYDQLCQDAQDDESKAQFIARMSTGDPFTSYTVGDLDLVTGSVPVDLRYADGDVEQVYAELGQNTTTGAFEVCGVGE